MGLDPLSVTSGLGNLVRPEETQVPGSVSELERIARELFGQTDPLRRGLIGRSEQFLEGGLDPTASPLFAPLKQATEQQFDLARERTLSSLPQGGALQSALGDIETGRAQTLTQGIGDISQGELSRALTLATGAPPQAIAGLSGAGGIQAQIAQANATQNAAVKEGLGRGVGAIAGSK